MSRTNFTSNYENNRNIEKDLSSWEWSDVNNWLKANNMNQYIESFKQYQINGYDLCYMTNEDLTEMKITNFHERNQILKNIRLVTLEQRK